ncbi:hypothetical protein ACP4OV_009522 [Aristida adscensionis]
MQWAELYLAINSRVIVVATTIFRDRGPQWFSASRFSKTQATGSTTSSIKTTGKAN